MIGPNESRTLDTHRVTGGRQGSTMDGKGWRVLGMLPYVHGILQRVYWNTAHKCIKEAGILTVRDCSHSGCSLGSGENVRM